MEAVAASLHGQPTASAETDTDTPASVFANASRIVPFASSIAARRSSSVIFDGDDGNCVPRIALRLLPPSSETSRNGTVTRASRSARPSALIAFDRPSAIPDPECPP